MNKVNVLSLALSLLSISLFSCSTNENNREIIVNFDFDENALSVEYDNNKNYLAGDNFTFKIKLNENYELNEVIANNEKLVKRPSGEYIFSLIEYENNVVITTSKLNNLTISTYEGDTNLNSYYTLWKNRGYPHFKSVGENNLLVVPLKIKGYEEYATSENLKKINDSFFLEDSLNTLGYYSLSEYYKISSYNKLNIKGEVTPWIDLDLTTKEISSSSISNYKLDCGTYFPTEKAINYIKENLNIDLTKYDNDKDGFIDGVYFIYGCPTFLDDSSLSTSTFWNFTYYNVLNKDKASISSPVLMTYSWSSFDMLSKGSDKTKLDTHTYIHEFGHQLGLNDYYDTSNSGGLNPYTSPMGGLDMMDNNVGDHSAFSKFALGWINPFVVSGDIGSVEVEIRSLIESGECIILPTSNYNNTPFDEYLMIEYIKNDSINKVDSTNGYPSTFYTDGRIIRFYSKNGIRITHIDARSVDSNLDYTDNINDMVMTKFSNTASTKQGYYCPLNNNSYVLTSLISANSSRNTLGTFFVANNTDLYNASSTIDFTSNSNSSRASSLPYNSNRFNDGNVFNYSIKIDSISESKASIKIY
ncbi:MAG: hypothetical protein SPJ27_09790 [Candidatus Onthovivens sp.]|nr:hypothetical protein [Candidatus Onthovivens sp.]